MSRSPNQSQRWHCDQCNTSTVHDVQGPGSRWSIAAGCRAFSRTKVCRRCGDFNETYELSFDDMRRIERQLASSAELQRENAALKSKLSDLQARFETLQRQYVELLTATRQKRAAERAIDELVDDESTSCPALEHGNSAGPTPTN